MFQFACDIKVVVNETLIYTSILTIVAFTIERYLVNHFRVRVALIGA